MTVSTTTGLDNDGNPSRADRDRDGWGDACDLDEASSCGASAALGSTPLPATLVFTYLTLDKKHSLLLGTVSGRSALYPNQLVAMSPTDGTILWSTYVGSDPSRIAVADDGSRAYVALDGAASIRVVQLEKCAACFQFPVVSPRTREVLLTGDMVVLPKQPETLVVAARRGTYSGDSTVQVLDNGTLTRTLPAPTAASYNVTQIIRFGASGLILNTSTGPKFMTIGI